MIAEHYELRLYCNSTDCRTEPFPHIYTGADRAQCYSVARSHGWVIQQRKRHGVLSELCKGGGFLRFFHGDDQERIRGVVDEVLESFRAYVRHNSAEVVEKLVGDELAVRGIVEPDLTKDNQQRVLLFRQFTKGGADPTEAMRLVMQMHTGDAE